MSDSTELHRKRFTREEFQDLSGPLYRGDFFRDHSSLNPDEIERHYANYSDIFISHDWGRELGLDNHARVTDAGKHLMRKGLRANLDLFGLLDIHKVKSSINSASCGLVFITRRYIRRYEERNFLAEEYDFLVKVLGLDRIIFVVMEKRMANRMKWTEQLNISADKVDSLHVLDMYMENGVDGLIANMGDLYDKILEVIKMSLDNFIKLVYMKSNENIFEAIKLNATTSLKKYVADNAANTERFIIQDSGGSTLLYHAAGGGNIDIVNLLLGVLSNHEEIDRPNAVGCTPLFIAASGGHVAVVRRLLKAGASQDKYNHQGHSPLYEAALRGHQEVLEILIHAKADINLADTNGLLPSDVAATAEIRALLCNLTQVHKELLMAAKNGNVEKFREIQKNNSQLNVNFKNEDGRTALFLAAADGHVGMVQELLNASADVNIKDNWLETPLTVTCFYARNATIVEMLLNANADINNKNVWGNTALFNNISWGLSDGSKSDIVTLLIERGVNVNEYGVFESFSCSPLQLSYKKERYEDMKQLVEAAATLDDALARQMLHDHAIFFQTFPNSASEVTETSNSSVFFSLKALSVHDFNVWFTLLQLEPATAAQDAALQAFVLSAVKCYPQLAGAKDAHGRVAVDVATKANKTAINSFFLWHGRYRIIDHHPEHVSTTCYVYRALDENRLDDTGNPIKVALKLIRMKSHFVREIASRQHNFDANFVVNILETYPATAAAAGSDLAEALSGHSDDCFATPVAPELETAALRKLRSGETIPQLSKIEAELMYCIVMPLGDRNMFVCLKQERFAGRVENVDEISYVFQQLVRCVEHLHQKGILHADIKTLNMVRSGIKWQLIDLDAASRIGVDNVGFKSSSAYIPPEAVYADPAKGCAVVRSAANLAKLQQENDCSFDLLVAHSSFDVWSLGCILYQLCTPDVRPLFQGGQDDNLTDNVLDHDNNLFSLAEWSDELKAHKLARAFHPLARNLLSQMLHRDPQKRPTIERVLSHTFLSKRQFTRLVGEEPQYDVFISYRVASDLPHAECIYNMLVAEGKSVWWDKQCLKAGVNWEQGFCSGLINSRYFLCILSRDGINKEGNSRQNLALLEESSPCDNVLLELRLALELRALGMIEKIFPVLVGDSSDPSDGEADVSFCNFFTAGCLSMRTLPEVAVTSVESNVHRHMEEQGLGSPVVLCNSVHGVVDAVLKCNGALIEGPAVSAFRRAVKYLLSDESAPPISRPSSAARSAKVAPVSVLSAGDSSPRQSISKVLEIRTTVAAAPVVVDDVADQVLLPQTAGLAHLQQEEARLRAEIQRLRDLYEANLARQKELTKGQQLVV